MSVFAMCSISVLLGGVVGYAIGMVVCLAWARVSVTPEDLEESMNAAERAHGRNTEASRVFAAAFLSERASRRVYLPHSQATAVSAFHCH